MEADKEKQFKLSVCSIVQNKNEQKAENKSWKGE